MAINLYVKIARPCSYIILPTWVSPIFVVVKILPFLSSVNRYTPSSNKNVPGCIFSPNNLLGIDSTPILLPPPGRSSRDCVKVLDRKL